MFFIFGINSGQKKLSSGQLVICNICGGYGRYQVFMSYTSLSLFFIPVFKWGRRYYVTMSCCGSVYDLNPEVGRRMARGENAEITPSDLTLVKAGTRQQWQAPSGTKRVCANCGYETQEDFAYCPKCGGRL